jgi:hypothetical protein
MSSQNKELTTQLILSKIIIEVKRAFPFKLEFNDIKEQAGTIGINKEQSG